MSFNWQKLTFSRSIYHLLPLNEQEVCWRFQKYSHWSLKISWYSDYSDCKIPVTLAKSLSFLIFWFLISYLYFLNNFFVFNFAQKVKSIHFDTKNVSSEKTIKKVCIFVRYTVSVQLREQKFCIRLTCLNGNCVSTKIGQFLILLAC